MWDSKNLSHALNVEINIDVNASRLEFNSLNILPGDLFIALQGENRDGHQFVQDALDRGAVAAIVEKEVKDDKRIIKVKSCIDALNQLAIYNRSRLRAKIIAITGSVGKTSTKEAFGQALSGFGSIFMARGNFNNHIGVPLNLASIPINADYVVLELGMNHAGEIRQLTKMVQPDIAVITKIAPAHLAFFKSIEEIAYAKAEIFESLSENGLAVINKDDDYYDILHNIAKKYTDNILSFGENDSSDIIINLKEKAYVV